MRTLQGFRVLDLGGFITGPFSALLLAETSGAALAQQDQFGTAQQARAMLDRAVAAVKADKAVALAKFNKRETRANCCAKPRIAACTAGKT